MLLLMVLCALLLQPLCDLSPHRMLNLLPDLILPLLVAEQSLANSIPLYIPAYDFCYRISHSPRSKA